MVDLFGFVGGSARSRAGEAEADAVAAEVAGREREFAAEQLGRPLDEPEPEAAAVAGGGDVAVAGDAVPETLAAFYAGAADQVVAVSRDADGLAVERRRTPTSDDNASRAATFRSSPPFVSLRGE